MVLSILHRLYESALQNIRLRNFLVYAKPSIVWLCEKLVGNLGILRPFSNLLKNWGNNKVLDPIELHSWRAVVCLLMVYSGSLLLAVYSPQVALKIFYMVRVWEENKGWPSGVSMDWLHTSLISLWWAVGFLVLWLGSQYTHENFDIDNLNKNSQKQEKNHHLIKDSLVEVIETHQPKSYLQANDEIPLLLMLDRTFKLLAEPDKSKIKPEELKEAVRSSLVEHLERCSSPALFGQLLEIASMPEVVLFKTKKNLLTALVQSNTSGVSDAITKFLKETHLADEQPSKVIRAILDSKHNPSKKLNLLASAQKIELDTWQSIKVLLMEWREETNTVEEIQSQSPLFSQDLKIMMEKTRERMRLDSLFQNCGKDGGLGERECISILEIGCYVSEYSPAFAEWFVRTQVGKIADAPEFFSRKVVSSLRSLFVALRKQSHQGVLRVLIDINFDQVLEIPGGSSGFSDDIVAFKEIISRLAQLQE